MLLDDRTGIGGGEWTVIGAIAGNLFLDFGLEEIAQCFGQPGKVEAACLFGGREYHCHWASCAMIEAAGGFELDLIPHVGLGDRLFKCRIDCCARAIATTTAIGIAGRSGFGADKNAVLAGWHGGWGEYADIGLRMPQSRGRMGLRGLAKNPDLAVWVVLD
jgi:hypothetical protein